MIMKTRLRAKIIGCFQMNPRENRGGKKVSSCVCVFFFFVTTLMLSSQGEERMLISQPPFKRIHVGIFETYKHFKNLASDVYTFLNRAAGVT